MGILRKLDQMAASPGKRDALSGWIHRGLRALSLALLLTCGPVPILAQTGLPGDEEYERLFVLANAEFTLLHELAHVVIWELKPPVLGREEDAADNIALIAELRTPDRPGEAGMIEKLQAVADGWKLEWKLIQEDELDNAYWDLHALEIQRYYNIACLVYGADPQNRAEVMQAAGLPADRAEWCHEEYAMAKHAVEWLLTQWTGAPESAFFVQKGVVSVRYEANTSLEGEKLDAWLKESGMAERLAEGVTRRFHLPRNVVITFETCPFANATWDVQTASIKFCHSLMNRFLYLARELQKERLSQAAASLWKPGPRALTPAGD